MKPSYTLSELKPIGLVPDFSAGENYLETFGINRLFWLELVKPTILKKFNNQCCVCKSNKNLQVHHKSYEEININNLFLVCKSCHKSIHGYAIDNELFLEFYNKGYNDREIAYKINVSKLSVLRKRHRLNLSSQRELKRTKMGCVS